MFLTHGFIMIHDSRQNQDMHVQPFCSDYNTVGWQPQSVDQKHRQDADS